MFVHTVGQGIGEMQPNAQDKFVFTYLHNRRTLILGDVSTGKTTMTVKLLLEALRSEIPNEITVIDMAPKKIKYDDKTIGGKMSDIIELPPLVQLIQPKKINAPRYSAKDQYELIRQVEENGRVIEEALEQYLRKPTRILFINDLSLYFQSGRLKSALDAMAEAETFVANAYHGRSLDNDLGTGISATERRLVEILARAVDLLIFL